MKIGDNIRNARKALNMSQDELAAAIGANRVTISQYERGIYLPSVPALDRLAEALNITPSQLTGGTEPHTDAPKTPEAQIVSAGMDKLPKEQREMILNMVCAMFPTKFMKGDDE